MPAILVVAGGTALYGAAGWGAFAAGTMIVSGLMARKSEIDGNKDAAAGWMAVGTIASLGATYTQPGQLFGASAPSSTTGALGVDSAQQSMLGQQAATTQESMLAAQTNFADAAAATGNAGTVAPSAETAWQASNAVMEKRLAEIASNNLKIGMGTAALQAGVAWEAGEEQAKVKREAIAEERRLSDRQYANTNNLTELKVQTPTNLPNLMGQARRQGLINATATTVK